MSEDVIHSARAIIRWKRQYDGWIGVDLDGTLAVHGTWKGELHIGEPIPKMVERVKAWIEAGQEVRIMTARAATREGEASRAEVIKAIQDWTEKHVGARLTVTNEKDYRMIELWDDRAVQIERNTGKRVDGESGECCYNGRCKACLVILPEEA